MTQHVIVGMSGGVDSSVAALLLKESGYDVECLFMKNWEEDENEACTSEADYRDALLVCEKLDIPLHSVNFAGQYWDRVFKYFLEEYSAGRTPNPDVLCNKEIKFNLFLHHAMNLGAERIAMGHYARVQKRNGKYVLLKGMDKSKDQSYFLYLLSQDQLSKSMFPVGELEKERVRQLAAKNDLVTSEKKDSTGICFIGERKFREFLQKYIPAQPGTIINEHGKPIGEHSGLMFYTIGQRKGLGIGGGYGDSEAPWYVADKNLDDNTLIAVQQKDHPLLYGSSLNAGSLHWVAGSPPVTKQLRAKIRYRQPDQECQIEFQANGDLNVRFSNHQFAIAPGQSVVFYEGDVCLGGGIITEKIQV